MMKYLIPLIALCYMLCPQAQAACTDGDGDGDNGTRVNVGGGFVLYTGDCTENDEVLIQTDSLTGYHACFLMSSAGAVDVFVTLNGSNYSTAAFSLEDKGATDGTDAVVTTAGTVYGFATWFLGVRIVQNGATDATAALLCRTY